MACRPKLPTGEKRPAKFQAPIYYPTEDPEQLQRLLGQAFGAVEDDLAALHKAVDTPPQTQPVTAVTGTVMAKAGDVLRLMPGPAGIQVLLPTSRSANKGDDVSIIIVGGATGTVTVRAVEGKVQDAASVTLTGGGLRVFRSDGGDGTATGAGGWWIVGRNSADSTAVLVGIGAGTQTASSGNIIFANSNGITFGMSGSSQITANYAGPRAVAAMVFGGSMTDGTLSLTNQTVYSAFTSAVLRENVLFSLNGSRLGATALVGFADSAGPFAATRLEFSNANAISWGLDSTTDGTGRIIRVTGSYLPQMGVVSHVGGNVQSSVTRLAFSNASGVTWSASTAASAVTMIASVNDQSIGLVSHIGGNQVSSVTRLAFSNASNVTWSLSTAAGAATVLASVAAAAATREIGIVSHIGGNVVSSVSQLAFSNASNVTWSLMAAAGGGGGVAVAGGTQTATSGTIVFSNSNNISFGLSGSTRMTASYNFNLSAGTTSNNLNAVTFSDLTTNANGVVWTYNASTLSAFVFEPSIFIGTPAAGGLASRLDFANSNGVTLGISTIGAGVVAARMQLTASYARELGLVSHIGGNVVSSVTRLAFSNASNVTWSLSTAANAATVIASVAAGGGAGLGIQASGQSVSAGTITFDNNTILTAGYLSASLNNVGFSLDSAASRMFATAVIRVTDGTNSTQTGGFQVTKLMFKDSPGITFGLDSTNDAQGRMAVVTAKVADVTHWRNWQAGQEVGGFQAFAGFNSTCNVFPLGMGPFPGNMTANTMELFISGFSTANSLSSWAFTCRGALYTLANSTQLSIINSFSSTVSSTSFALANSVTHNNLYAGGRWLTVHSSQWSVQPVLSAGVQYWMAVNWSTANTQAFSGWNFVRQLPSPQQFNGILGSSVSAAQGRGLIPFLGQLNTGAPPSTIGTAGLQTVTAGQPFGIPLIQMRQGIDDGL